MKKLILMSLAVTFILAAMAGCMNNKNGTVSSTASKNDTTSVASAEKNDAAPNELGEYTVDIKSSRMAKDYEGKDIIIVSYSFKNNSEDSASFSLAINDKVFQNGVGLNKCYVAAENANYSSDNQTKDIKKGAALDVEVAYYLNDTKTPIEVECSKLISFDDKTITKTFNLK